MDHATASLDAITNGRDYVPVEGVPIFDAHDEFDADGNLIRRFDTKKLEDICKRSNQRADETGDLSPVGPGHTIQDGPETSQPPVYAYAKNYRVGKFGPSQKTGILVDMYVKKTVDDGKGNDVDGLRAFKSYPRRSVELWLKDGYIDWIALLRKTPQRDLGLIAYEKNRHVSLPSTGRLFGSPARTRGLSAAVRGGKLCYSMDSLEANMDPTLPATANGPDADFEAKIESFLKTRYPHLDKVYEEAASKFDTPATEPRMDDMGGDPMGGDLPPMDAPPVGDMPDPNKLDFAKDPRSAKNHMIYLTKQLKRIQDERDAERKAREAEKIKFSKVDAQRRVDALQQDGFIINKARELERFEKMQSFADRDEREQEIRDHHKQGHSRHLPPVGIVPTSSPSAPRRLDYSREVIEQATRYVADHPNETYEDALAKFAK